MACIEGSIIRSVEYFVMLWGFSVFVTVNGKVFQVAISVLLHATQHKLLQQLVANSTTWKFLLESYHKQGVIYYVNWYCSLLTRVYVVPCV